MIAASEFSYLILTHRLPTHPYTLKGGYTLQAVNPSKEFLEQAPCNVYSQLMALPYVDRESPHVYEELVMFHSFLADDPETYAYAEYVYLINSQFRLNSDLHYLSDLATWPPTSRRSGAFEFNKETLTDFERFEVILFWDVQDITTGDENLALKVPEQWRALDEGTWIGESQTAREEVSYRRAFELFRRLKTTNPRLYNQICLYVFTRCLGDLHRVYRNDYMDIAFYIAILESIIGEPLWCTNDDLKCEFCGKTVPHRVKSLENHFMEKYGSWFKNPRRVRHKFFHGVAQSDFIGGLLRVYDDYDYDSGRYILTEKDVEEEKSLHAALEETEKLQQIVRKHLLELFLSRYFQETS